MFTHFVIIISCFSMIGVTAVPAALINCCCKSKDRVCSMAKASPRSCSAGMKCSIPSSPESKSCCSQKHVSSVSQDSLKKDCPNCRCLEHLQTVSLSGQNTVNESNIRFSAYTAALSELPVFSQESVSLETALFSNARGTPVNLQTCSLRC
ncbi:hypothetical protein Desti_4481 [Desulfomonile tiedjei DSM 6799]|uniref:Uncharacterized protein n=1 Tax=Desulfomonile tiedjei (strain ATCC 49306 / DSM 6799 / DCB-1) TaxID=706587 RepID=I4CC22_DESTA|nr:hypothetical protein Desti_4481 [Desulfomonile tiedjei DSM 6799]